LGIIDLTHPTRLSIMEEGCCSKLTVSVWLAGQATPNMLSDC